MKLIFIHILDENTIQNGTISTGWQLISIIMSHSSIKSNTENAHKCIK